MSWWDGGNGGLENRRSGKFGLSGVRPGQKKKLPVWQLYLQKLYPSIALDVTVSSTTHLCICFALLSWLSGVSWWWRCVLSSRLRKMGRKLKMEDTRKALKLSYLILEFCLYQPSTLNCILQKGKFWNHRKILFVIANSTTSP